MSESDRMPMRVGSDATHSGKGSSPLAAELVDRAAASALARHANSITKLVVVDGTVTCSARSSKAAR